jgi:ubiquinone/menaquinone biosynthesis C-methylase UbiE
MNEQDRYLKINEIYNSIPNGDNPNYKYSIRNKHGFYSRFIFNKNLVYLLNKNKLLLSKLENILDIGCGNGSNLNVIAGIRGSSKGLYGIDLSEMRIENAKMINSSIKFSVNDMRELPYENDKFDMVTAFVSFMYLTDDDDLKKTFSEVKRVLKPGSYFLFYDVVHNNKRNNTRGYKPKFVKNYCKKFDFDFVYLKGSKKYFFLPKLNILQLAKVFPFTVVNLISCFPLPFSNHFYLLQLNKK